MPPKNLPNAPLIGFMNGQFFEIGHIESIDEIACDDVPPINLRDAWSGEFTVECDAMAKLLKIFMVSNNWRRYHGMKPRRTIR